jgi:glucose-6-phosphate 1-dehydrogenase
MSHDEREISSVNPEVEKRYKIVSSCEMEIPGPFCLVIFGASGDLTRRKIVPALYRLRADALLPETYFILGISRTAMDNESFRGAMRESVMAAFPEDFVSELWDEFAGTLYYTMLDYNQENSYGSLRSEITALEKKHDSGGNRIFYLAIPPDMYETVITHLGSAGLSNEEAGYTHIIVEKPIGRDLESAKKLNTSLRESFRENQIYRMDHYLAKETVQNILMFRFANSIFEPLWNRRYIDHVQITVSETIGIEQRAGYYDKSGIIRDMFQNHIMELLALVAMEPPAVFDAERVRDEKFKVFCSVRPFALDRLEEGLVVGQYGEGTIDGRHVSGYRNESGISSDSATPTFAACKVYIDNWRWNGVPFYLRSGKRLSKRQAEVSVHYKPVPHHMFAQALRYERIEPNTLLIRVQPDEGISLIFQAKRAGSRICLDPALMDFSYSKVVSLSDYERILLDCMQGDQMLFVREDGVETTWSLFSPVVASIESETYIKKFPNYAAGSMGPVEASFLIERDGRKWRSF